MKTHLLLVTLFVLLTSFTTFGQTSTATTTAANASWPTFWRQFSAAVNKKDHGAMLRLMPSDFFDGGGGMTGAQWLQYLDQNQRHGSWRDLKRSVARGTIVNRNWKNKVPTRVTRDNGYYFEFRKDRKWYFAGVVGD